VRPPGGEELPAALDAYRPCGSVLELACGPGGWTGHLLRYATSITAVDGSAEMLAIARAKLHDERVQFVHGDLFRWQPDDRYDVVSFAVWLSHVPLERFESFWALVDQSLKPAGRVFFANDNYRTADELIEGEQSSTIRRQLLNGTAHRLVKVPHRPADLQARLRRLGWQITVTSVSGPYFWGEGRRA
jgi:demethylmenaquinone methyltransferase/2-methoxy-6-polyprenyl-1,4-benzoquinol methylase